MMAVSTCALLLNSYTCRRPAASGQLVSLLIWLAAYATDITAGKSITLHNDQIECKW